MSSGLWKAFARRNAIRERTSSLLVSFRRFFPPHLNGADRESAQQSCLLAAVSDIFSRRPVDQRWETYITRRYGTHLVRNNTNRATRNRSLKTAQLRAKPEGKRLFCFYSFLFTANVVGKEECRILWAFLFLAVVMFLWLLLLVITPPKPSRSRAGHFADGKSRAPLIGHVRAILRRRSSRTLERTL